MLDFSHIKNGPPTLDIQEFTQASPADGSFSQVWHKPRSASMVSILLIGGGGGGGRGRAGANSAASGGGGGGSGAFVDVIVPAWVLPNVLYISIGQGGLGSSTGNGGSGIASRIAAYPNTSAGNSVLLCNGGGGGGSGNLSTTAGTAGTAATASAASTSFLGGLLSYGYLGSTTNISVAGVPGSSGGTTSTGAAFTVSRSLTLGGTGGGALGSNATTGAAGGVYTNPASPTVYPVHNGGLGGGTTTSDGGHGSNGFPVYFNGTLQALLGGTGGASGGGVSGNGGNGGNGAIGCGGGGGGSCFTGFVAGSGGNGGDGYCLIASW